MAAISGTVLAATAIAGIGMQAYGYSQQREGAEAAAAGARIQAQGAMRSAEGAKKQAEGSLVQVEGAGIQNQATKAITQLEFQGEAKRMEAMELDAKRTQLEIIRNHQRARALGLTSATAQGAQSGSGLQGGYGQVAGQSGVNLLGVQQNLGIGRDMFAINSGISQQRLRYAEGGDVINRGAGIIAQGAGIIAEGQGISAQGGGMISAAQGQISMGQGLASLGGAFVQAAPTLGNIAGSVGSAFGRGSYGWGGQGMGTYNYRNGGIGGLY